jgi:hypothetical protein
MRSAQRAPPRGGGSRPARTRRRHDRSSSRVPGGDSGASRHAREDPPSPRLLVVGLLRASRERSRGRIVPRRIIPSFPICGHLRDLWFAFRSPSGFRFPPSSLSFALCALLSPTRCSALFSLLVGVVIDRLGQPRFVPASHGAECHRKLPRFRFQAQKRNLTYKSHSNHAVNHCL